MFSPYYNSIIRKYHIAFGSIFKDLVLLRNEQLTNDGNEAQRFTVPIEYSNREFWLSRLRQDPDLSRKDLFVVPRLAFEMVGMEYDAARRLNSLNQRISGQYGIQDTAKRYFVGTPYNLKFKVYALTRSIEDANQIAEHFIPFFIPDYSLTVKVFPSLGILDRMRLIMDDHSPVWEDNYIEANKSSTREILLTFSFTAQATLYGPIADTPATIIRKVIVDLYDARYDKTLTGPLHILSDNLDRFVLEDESGRLINEDSVIDLQEIARVSRIEVEPDPIDAAPIKPVDVTITTTRYEDGKVTNVFTSEDVEIGS